jgi:hypothetical protein
LLLDDRLRGGRMLPNTHLDREGEPVAEDLDLRADEGVMVELQGSSF